MRAHHAASPAAISQRSASRRRLRRRGNANPLYCATNGCASFLRLDPTTGVATCPICGFRRRVA